MVYEVISPEAHGNGTIVGMHTESPACIDSLDTQKAMLDAKSKITFTGTVNCDAVLQSGKDAVKDVIEEVEQSLKKER